MCCEPTVGASEAQRGTKWWEQQERRKRGEGQRVERSGETQRRRGGRTSEETWGRWGHLSRQVSGTVTSTAVSVIRFDVICGVLCLRRTRLVQSAVLRASEL